MIITSYEPQLINLINQERRAQGLSPLQTDSQLTQLARTKAQDMSQYQTPTHYSPTLGGTEIDQLNNANISYEEAGANIFWGNGKQFTPEEAVTWWMNSPGHRANILNPNFTHIGVGYDYSPNAPTQNSFSMIAIRKTRPQNGWVQENGKWYYYVNGTFQTGWVQVGSSYYYFDNTGAFTGWAWYQGTWYYWNGSWWRWNGTSWESGRPPA
ncbi:CAP domain-containing protein [Priestia aryabhattai]|uniref:CAP domain-containing protein n=1 Tax=Priestia TaxID=2800373 RepID=UPI00069BC952